MKKFIKILGIVTLMTVSQIKPFKFSEFNGLNYNTIEKINDGFKTFQTKLNNALQKNGTSRTKALNFYDKIFTPFGDFINKKADKSNVLDRQSIIENIQSIETIIENSSATYKKEVKMALYLLELRLIKSGFIITDEAKKIVEGLNMSIKALNDEIFILNKELETQKETIDEAKEVNQEIIDKNKNLLDKLEAVQNLNKKALELKPTVDKLSENFRKLETENSVLDNKIIELNKKLKLALDENEELKTQNVGYVNKLKELSVKSEQSLIELEKRLQAEIEKIKEEKNELAEQMEKLKIKADNGSKEAQDKLNRLQRDKEFIDAQLKDKQSLIDMQNEVALESKNKMNFKKRVQRRITLACMLLGAGSTSYVAYTTECQPESDCNIEGRIAMGTSGLAVGYIVASGINKVIDFIF